jgi:branched-chain amino acid transport system substrate-binding protein
MAISGRNWLVGATLFVLVGCGGEGEMAPVWIGHLSPLSGPDRASGESARRGIVLAVEEANKHPDDQGAGRPVRVLHADTHGDSRAFGAEATRLVTVNRVVALLGGQRSADVKGFRRLDRPDVFLVTPLGLPGESLSSSRIFFTGLSPADRGRALARFAAEKGFGHVIVLVDEDEQGGQFLALAEAFKDRFPQAWAKEHRKRKPLLAGPRRYGKDNPLRDRALRIRQELTASGQEKQSAAILVAGKPSAVKRLREELGPRVPILFGGAEGGLHDLQEEAETRSGVYLATAFASDAGTDLVKEFVRKFKSHFGGDLPDVHAALAYDDARLLFRAMRQAKTADVDPVRKELAGLKDFASLTGPLSFDKQQQARRAVFIVGIERGNPIKLKRYPPAR